MPLSVRLPTPLTRCTCASIASKFATTLVALLRRLAAFGVVVAVGGVVGGGGGGGGGGVAPKGQGNRFQ